MFIDKFNFAVESQISVHLINHAFTTKDLEPLGISGNVCLGSPQNIIIFPPKKSSFLVKSFSIRLTANMLYECVINASSHIIDLESFNNFPNVVFNLTLHVDVFKIGIGIPRKLCAVLPPFYNYSL